MRIRPLNSVFFCNRNHAMIKYPILESIPVQYMYKNRFLLEMKSESSNSEKCSKSDSGIDSSPGIITPLVPSYYKRFNTGNGEILPCVGCCQLPFLVTLLVVTLYKGSAVPLSTMGLHFAVTTHPGPKLIAHPVFCEIKWKAKNVINRGS